MAVGLIRSLPGNVGQLAAQCCQGGARQRANPPHVPAAVTGRTRGTERDGGRERWFVVAHTVHNDLPVRSDRAPTFLLASGAVELRARLQQTLPDQIGDAT